MRHEEYSVAEHGFAGHLAEPDAGSDRAVIIIMGGEKSLLPGIKFAERFSDFGVTGLAVSLFGADGLPASPDRIPLEPIGETASAWAVSDEAKARMKEIDPRDPLLHWDMFDTMLRYYKPKGDLPRYILGKADEDDYTGFLRIVMYFAGDEVFAGIAPDYEKSFLRCGGQGFRDQDQARYVPRLAGVYLPAGGQGGRAGDHRGYPDVL